VERPAPLVGQHTREILAEFGFAENEIADYTARGALPAR
jgi:crotonobetainyl-CoA:carnitine CoA-transferase CaiB-like acyl-CoA transferase